MQKEFNDTGLCVVHRHYMVDISSKIVNIITLIDKGKYFSINRPRQFGKTTTLSLLFKTLNQLDDYLTFKISFEGVGDAMFADEQAFCPALLRRIGQSFMVTNPELSEFFMAESKQVHNFEDLSQWISRYVMQLGKHVVLMIDEVDKSSDNQIFLHFLGMLREKYLKRNEGEDYTFQSVILAGVHDIKTLKLKIRPDAEQKYNSPWNIAVDFNVDLSFCQDDIATMLQDYGQDKQISMNMPAIAEKLYYYTSGYPYLVSKLCKFIDEAIVPARNNPNWSVDDVDEAFNRIVDDS
ncbi:MAG: AAA family ATPase, partial [bacterium]|nr:AAA family ATPase [bacterium]